MAERAAFVETEGHAPGEQLVDGVLDFGRLIEALIVYDRVYLSAPREGPFAALCRRLVADGDLAEFIALLRNRELIVVDYDYYTCIQVAGPGSVAGKAIHLRDPLTIAGKAFEQLSLGASALQTILSGSQRVKLRRAALQDLFLIKQGDHGALLIHDANADYANPAKASFLLSRLAAAAGVGMPAGPLVRSVDMEDGGFARVNWTVDLEALDLAARALLKVDQRVISATGPLGAAIGRDRLLWDAKVTGSDLHVSRPMDEFITEKLREAGNRTKSVGDIVTAITTDAEFPDIRGDANLRLIKLSDALHFRRKAKRFRQWLHEERTHDRDAVRAYLGEFAVEAGLGSMRKQLLSISATVVGAGVGAAIEGATGALLGAGAGRIAGGVAERVIAELSDGLTGTWRPLMFGSWLNRQIAARAIE